MDATGYARRHLRFGWGSLLAFLSLGIALEAFHGFKVSWYLNEAYAARRLLWTLAHAHGVLLALVNVVFGLTVHVLADAPARHRRLASPCLIGGSLVLPLGFFAGGAVVYGGDPGLGVVLVPVGAALLVAGVGLAARDVAAATRGRQGTDQNP
jgi:hypothetical protein